MRVIITGGTGLIGKALAAELAQDGYEVIVLSRNPGQRPFLPQVRIEKWDGKTAVGWGHLADGTHVDGGVAIVNLAAESIAGNGFLPARWTPERKRRIVQSRLDAGQAVTEAIAGAATKPAVLLQASAVGYYGACGDEPLGVEAAPGHDFLAHVCQQWEAKTAVVPEMGVRRVLLRTGVVLSKEGGALPLMMLPFKFFVGGPLGSGKQWIPWIHLHDQVRAMRFLLENEAASGPFNLSAPNPLTNRDFAAVLGAVLKRPSFIPVPAFALKAALGEIATIVLDGQRALPYRLQEMGFAFKFATAKAALTDLLQK
ncbi:MAG: TIGR01777 family oxidoreductase [Anaerolineales bacterium]|nr:TIGR01777 family oxidoreductase [Anaerolineales bacterium]